MTIWPVQHAKARFSELLDACQREGPQVVSRRGTETAVLVPPRGDARRRPVVELKIMAFLLDTNVVSELRRPRPHGAVLAWLQSVDDADLHLASVNLSEIQAGIERTREQGPAKASEIEDGPTRSTKTR